MKKWTAYIIYGIIALLVFLYLLFPSDSVKQAIVRQAGAIAPAVAVSIDAVSPNLPPGLTLKNLQVAHEDQQMFRSSRLTLTPAYLTLFSQRKMFHFTGEAYEGTFNGRGTVETASKQQGSAELVFSGVQLSKIDALTAMMPHQLSGSAEGRIQYDSKTGSFGEGEAEATIKECRVTLETPVFGFESLAVGSVNAVLELEGNAARVKQIRINGSQVTGKASGTIDLQRPLTRSRLDLKGTVKPHPSFIKELGQAVPSRILSMGDYAEKGVPFRISGTLERPKISLDKR